MVSTRFPRRLISLFLSVGLLLAGTPVRAQADAYQAALASLDEVMQNVQEIRDLIDRTAFDLEALSFELFFEDAAGIVAWVRDNIAYQPYAGLLRGAQGTLWARAGNALDQSVLLANLLNDAGFEARIALGQLDDEQAAALLETTATADLRDYSELKEAFAAVPGLDVEALFDLAPDAARLQETSELADTMISSIEAAGLTLAAEQPALIEEAAHYAWVEYRLGDGDWESAHPAADFLADAGVVADRYLEDEVPEELQHRIRFEVEVESLNGDELVVAPVMTPWERPAANAAGVVIDYTNVPNTASEAANISEVLSTSEYFVPTFMGGVPEGVQAFDMVGALLEPEFMADPMAGVFRTVRGGFMDAIGALGGLNSDEPAGEAAALTAQWLVVTLVAPDGTEREFRRSVFDRIGEEARAAGETQPGLLSIEEAQLRLLGEHRLMVFPGDVPFDYLLDQYLQSFLDTRPMLERAIALQFGQEPAHELADVLLEPSSLEGLVTMQMFDGGPTADSTWRSEPGLIMYSDMLAGTPEESVIVSRLDIMNNARRVLGPEAGAQALSQGVWETLTERDILADTSTNTANFGTDFQVLTPGGQAPGSLTAEARSNLQRDLDHGYAVLLPAGAETWWRVDLATGETLGVTADGRGQSMTEYTIMLYDNAFTLMFAMKSFNDCTTAGSSWEVELCCLARAHVSAIFGIGLGGAISGSLGGAVGAMASLQFNLVTGFGGADWSPPGMC